MKKNKTAKVVVNGAVLAALAAIGAAAFRLGTSTGEKISPQEITYESDEYVENILDSEEEEPLVDAGTSQVEASLDETLEYDTEENMTDGESMAEMSDSEESAEEDTEEADTASAEVQTLDFSEDTLTEWPVYGTILLDYNMDQTTYFPTLDQYRLSSAIAVQAVEGAPVVAAAKGTVFSIEETSQTGITVTMELGNGYQAIYGQLSDLTISEGETVEKGAVIGYIAAPTKYYSTEGSNLYFAMKQNGEPIDPVLYLP